MGGLIHIHVEHVVEGTAAGIAISSDMPLSFWGGFDPDSGKIIDRQHPLAGVTATDKVLVIPSGRGSCSGSGTVLEALRNGTAPAAIVLSTIDPIICLGAILGDELYGLRLPVVVAADADLGQISSGDQIAIRPGES